MYVICVLKNIKVQKLHNVKQVDETPVTIKKQRQTALVGCSHRTGEEGFQRKKTTIATVLCKFQLHTKSYKSHAIINFHKQESTDIISKKIRSISTYNTSIFYFL